MTQHAPTPSDFRAMSYSQSRDLLPAVQKDRTYQPDKWTARHRYIVSLEMSGLTNAQIAAVMDMSEGRVSVILNDPRAEVDRKDFASAVADRITDVGVRFQLHANEALDELVEELRQCEDVRVRQKSAIAILDRAGYSKYQGEQTPQPDIGDEVADRLERAAGEINLVEGVDYKVLPIGGDPDD